MSDCVVPGEADCTVEGLPFCSWMIVSREDSRELKMFTLIFFMKCVFIVVVLAAAALLLLFCSDLFLWSVYSEGIRHRGKKSEGRVVL